MVNKLVLIICLTLVVQINFSSLFGQSVTFPFIYSSDLDEMPVAACELTNGAYIISARQGVYEPGNFQYKLLLIKLNSFGDTILSRLISTMDGSCYINSLISDTGNTFFGIGSSRQSSSETSVWAFQMTENFEIIWEQYFKTNCERLGSVQGFINSTHNLIIYGDGYTGISTYDDLFIYKISHTGDSLSFSFYQDPASETAWSMTENPVTFQYYLINSGRYQVNTNSIGQILTLDSNLVITGIDSLPGALIFYYNGLFSSGSLYLTGTKIIVLTLSEALHLLGIEKLDSNLQIVNQNSFGSLDPDTISFPGYFKNIDNTVDNRFYYGGTFNQDKNVVFSNLDSWFYLIRLDTNFNIEWQMFYGGEKYYSLWGIKSTSDGGCLLLGSTFDSKIQYNERDIIIIKVDSNGVLTGIVGDGAIKRHNAILYPNPGTDYLIVESGPQIHGASFYMVDIQGNIVVRALLEQTRSRIATSDILPGAYIWHITFRGEVIETGKWLLCR